MTASSPKTRAVLRGAAVLLTLTTLTGCTAATQIRTVDATTGPHGREVTRWAQNWCAAKAAGSIDEAIALLGEPTRRRDETYYWESARPAPGFQLQLMADHTGHIYFIVDANTPPRFHPCGDSAGD